MAGSEEPTHLGLVVGGDRGLCGLDPGVLLDYMESPTVGDRIELVAITLEHRQVDITERADGGLVATDRGYGGIALGASLVVLRRLEPMR